MNLSASTPRSAKLLALFALFAAFLSFTSPAFAASSITGSVRNQTREAPAAGDDVILILLDHPVQEEARSKTDANGAFNFNVGDPHKHYLVRVFHEGVDYDSEASAGDTLSIQVFDRASRVRSITGNIEILRTGTQGGLLHVSEMYEITNESRPPITEAGKRTFEVYLPANARISSVLAAASGTMGQFISASPVPGQPGHYAVDFPLRPGATKFAFNYDVPYDGHLIFRAKQMFAMRQLAVMTPPAMKFASASPVFQLLAAGNSRYDVHAADNLRAGEGPEFEISGNGPLPPLGDAPASRTLSSAPVPPRPQPNLPGTDANRSAASSSVSVGASSRSSSLGVSSSATKNQPRSETLALRAVSLLLLAACAFGIWRTRKSPSPSTRKHNSAAR